ncbi:MAG: hypothetical protein JNL53_07690 [Cyclobacteriaceae bacterium]|nr:hypothetical protein [Cyclobacteriaceae bacterium]
MRYLSLILLIISYTSGSAQQFAMDLWHTGKTVLDSGDTLRGNLKYDLKNDILQVDLNNKMESYTARKVLFFEIFDETVKKYRLFYSLPYSTAGQYKAPIFFELLVEGKLTVLCRESFEYRTTSSPLYYYGTYSRIVLINKYYLLKENGDIIEFQGKKNDWFDQMQSKKSEVAKYAKTNRLDMDEKYDLARVIDYYNSLYK